MDKKRVHVYRGGPIGDQHAPVTLIRIGEEFPPVVGTKETEWRPGLSVLFQSQGRILAEALFGALPGGTIDALLREMLERRASLLVVPHAVARDVCPLCAGGGLYRDAFGMVTGMPCAACAGRGVPPVPHTCPVCRGFIEVDPPEAYKKLYPGAKYLCPACAGKGVLWY